MIIILRDYTFIDDFRFAMSNGLSVRSRGKIQLSLEWYSWNLILNVVLKFVRKIKLSLKPDKNNVYFTFKSMHVYDSVWMNYFRNEKYFRQRCTEKTHHPYSIKFLFENSHRLWDKFEKTLYSRTGHKWQHGACSSYAVYLRLQTHAQNM
jgi:hypothetical protein